MQIIPAIDLRGGKCVRLQQGDYGRETVFGDDLVSIAVQWESQGAERLHLVDLDGARTGQAANAKAVVEILRAVSIPCQLGGGVREEDTIEGWLNLGVDRVIVGTKALKDPAWFSEMATRYPQSLILGLDARDGRVATDGWLDVSSVEAVELAQRYSDLPLAGLVYTDIARDGMLSGPNVEATGMLARRVKLPVIASGGIGCLVDIESLLCLGLQGCIVGRALYDGRFSLGQALELVRERSLGSD